MIRTFIIVVNVNIEINYLEPTNNLLFSDYLITTNLLKKQKITKTLNNCKNKISHGEPS